MSQKEVNTVRGFHGRGFRGYRGLHGYRRPLRWRPFYAPRPLMYGVGFMLLPAFCIGGMFLLSLLRLVFR